MSDPRTIDLAIVGAGPKGFGCLERLVIEMNRCVDPPRLRVSLHDPASHPGAGPVYDPTQPPYLLMNFAARHIDVWSRDGWDLGDGRADLVSWLAVHHPEWADGNAFVPRRLVGAYLQAAFGTLLEALPPQLTVDRVAGVVTDLQRSGSGWWVRHDDPALDRYVDEVMITVGHGTWKPGSTPRAPAGEPRCGYTTTISPPYPVATQLGPDRIPPSVTVAVRGFALSFIDATLALTVGRGGRFEGIDSGAVTPARYHASGAEVERILPFSRTGLPLLAKPGPELVARAGELPHVWERLCGRIQATTGAPLLAGLRDALAEAARAVLRRVRRTVPDAELQAIDALLRVDRRAPPTRRTARGSAATSPGIDPERDPRSGLQSLAAMRRSLEVATERRPPDAAWAVGESWRQGYPALVERVGRGGVTSSERWDLDVLAVRMERLAFGAPAENLHRMIVLVDAGLVDLGHLRAPRVIAHDAGSALVTGDRHTPIDVLVDAVIEPPGVTPGTPLWGRLLRRRQVRVASGTRGVEVTADATCVDGEGRRVPGLAAVGRATEGWVLGNDTLSRTLHAETRRWAHRILTDDHDVDSRLQCPPMTSSGVRVADGDWTALGAARIPPTVTAAEREVRRHCHGTPPVEARLEPWQVALCGQPERLQDLVHTYGSPVNVHSTGPFDRNVAQLQAVAAARQVPLEILFARKADKALAYIDRARELRIGVDTASEEELTQVLQHGVDPTRVVSTAAIKTEALLRVAIGAGITIVLDNDDELERVLHLAEAADSTVPVALRFGGFHLEDATLSTRFGFEVARGHALGAQLAGAVGRHAVRLEGVHFHLDGYDVAHRIAGVAQLLPLIDTLREQGHPIRHVDVGGGLPMSYVDDAAQWATFGTELRRALVGARPPITYANNGLGLFAHDRQVHGELALYPYHQGPTAPDWLAALLDARLDTGSVAEGLRARALTLRCEPGRSLLDGCGLTVARVEHRKLHADGSWSVGAAMNRTQCATAKADHAVDPLLVPTTDTSVARTGPIEGHLMGAYCTESDLLTWRRLRFPSGVVRGDLVVFPNTAGYLMHFVESRSHRFPLANNVVLDERGETFALDAIDGTTAISI